MLKEETDEPFVGSQWRAVNDQRHFRLVVAVGELQTKPSALGKVYLVGGEGKLTTYGTPDLYINFRTIKSTLVRNLNKRNI